MINLGFFPSRRLAFYMAKLFLTRSIAVLFALVLILMTLDLLGEWQNPRHSRQQRCRSLALCRLADSHADLRFLPFSVLLGALIAFVGSIRMSEVVAMKAAGLSAHQILAPLVVVSIGIAAGLFAFNEGVVVNSTRAVTAWSDNDYKPVPRASGIPQRRVDSEWRRFHPRRHRRGQAVPGRTSPSTIAVEASCSAKFTPPAPFRSPRVAIGCFRTSAFTMRT